MSSSAGWGGSPGCPHHQEEVAKPAPASSYLAPSLASPMPRRSQVSGAKGASIPCRAWGTVRTGFQSVLGVQLVLALSHFTPTCPSPPPYLWTLKPQHQMQRQPARGDSAISSHNGRPNPEANPIAYLCGEPLSNGSASQNH